MKKITKREIIAFLLGIFVMFLFETIYNWEDAKRGFLDGYNSVRKVEKGNS